ncbi:hypothetical protein Cme02nite_73200 [Catellatospora methionotrophica]|uniref:Uncharacterized protein n=1 Tax=Catellatospora methionotrophica TaxID=121620 RepID=A0A8J3LIL0_9ACTN|nr:hypothetical protein [Catellatospora methionotrophica]GIG18988.1 hypothetical protein Cme02nite_73200 [Catellatospora methionotrophica]
MYLVIAIVDTPGHLAELETVRRRLVEGAAGTDRLEHVYLAIRPGGIACSLYLRAEDEGQARQLAEQLVRRTMATLPGLDQWSLHLLWNR